MDTNSRKRLRSDETPISLQNKIYVNQKTIDLNDAGKMKLIYDKTVSLLFKGARKIGLSNHSKEINKMELMSKILLKGNGSLKFFEGEKPSGLPDNSASSTCCNKAAFIASDCSNCNLGLCEHCAFSCTGNCGSLLCGPCIALFGCGTYEEPICERCRYLK